MKRLIPLLLFLCALGTTAHAQDYSFQLKTDDGQIDHTSLKGQVVYLDFWASWCAPCRASFPWMNSLQQRYQAQGLKIIAINLDKERVLADKFLKNTPANFTIAYDPEAIYAEKFGIKGMPTSLIIGRDGKLIGTHTGFRKEKIAKYEAAILQALQEGQ